MLCSVAVASAVAVSAWPSEAEACGCLSPPDPVALGSDDFAVNQQAEQIMFEVGEQSVTAHVLIRYAGDPEQFAWIVPVPNAPELALSEQLTFALVDDGSAPRVSVNPANLCPVPEFQCVSHQFPNCDAGGSDGFADEGGDGTGGFDGDAGGGDDGADGPDSPPPGVDVIDMQMVGSYETVTFAADEPELAVAWLQDNGFIVNDTMTPYMQPYIDAGMVFVAAKLEAGAGIEAIAPLQMTYAGTTPMIPLQLTAVAAEPHLTVTAYIFADEAYRPVGHPEVEIPEAELAIRPSDRRGNYPMLMSRKIDEAGGDAWVREYTGPTFGYQPADGSGCCGSGEFDNCGIGGDTQCQCPLDDFDQEDCAQVDGLLSGIELLTRLQTEHSVMTRLTTRLSPEEMTYDPMFEPGTGEPVPSILQATDYLLNACAEDVVEPDRLAAARSVLACATTYCGEGECVATGAGVGCDCNAGFVAREYTELDGLPSVTCVPQTPPVDLGANTTLPDVCAGVACGDGTCVDLGGFPACSCNAGAAGSIEDEVFGCVPIVETTGGAGADNFSRALMELEVCAPPPPTCGQYAWLEPIELPGIHGTMCASSTPDPSAFDVPPMPTCESDSSTWGGGVDGGADGDAEGMPTGGCGCVADRGSSGGGLLFALMAVLGWRLRRRET